MKLTREGTRRVCVGVFVCGQVAALNLYQMSSTLIPDFPDFPYLDPPAPQSHAIPLSKKRKVRLTERRNLQHETADLSEEEEEVDDMVCTRLLGNRDFRDSR